MRLRPLSSTAKNPAGITIAMPGPADYTLSYHSKHQSFRSKLTVCLLLSTAKDWKGVDYGRQFIGAEAKHRPGHQGVDLGSGSHPFLRVHEAGRDRCSEIDSHQP